MVNAYLGKFFIGLLLLFLAFGDAVQASHSQGGNITYECLGGNQYRITLAFYRDCEGVSAPTSPIINISSASCNQNFNVNLTLVSSQEVSPVCQNDQTECTGGSLPGVEEYIYEAVVDFPANCADWVMSYNLCCRNAAINTIDDPDDQDIHLESTMDNLNVTCNSSPVFSNRPIPFVCVGQLFCFNHGALDQDGDSLVYSLITPMNGPGSTVNYLGGYSAQQPLNSNPPVFFDTQTGDICMTPQQLQVTVVAVLVEEYRNGQLIGTVIRDIQIRVVQCSNETPYLDGIDMTGSGQGNGQYQATTCAGTELCFFINSFDDDQNQNVTLQWNQGIDGATFTTTQGPRPVGEFCWTPDQSDISNNAHCFTVLVQDDNCPYFGTSVYSFCITVTGLTVNAGPDQDISCVNQTQVSATVSGGTGNYTYTWNTGETTPTITVPEGRYWVDVDDGGGCLGSDTVEVNYIDDPEADFTFNSPCLGQATVFTDNSVGNGGTNITGWDWDFGDGSGSSTDQNPNYQYQSSGDYEVTLIAENNLGCTDTISDTVTIQPTPNPAFDFVSQCEYDTLSFTDLSTISSGEIVSWSWDFGDGSPLNNDTNPTHYFPNDGSFDVTLIVESDTGCTNSVTESVVVHDQPMADFSPTDVCFNTATDFTDESIVNNAVIDDWLWDFDSGNQTSTQESPSFTYPSDGTFDVTLIATSEYDCADTITQTVTVHPLPEAGFTHTIVCADMVTSFTDTSNINSGNIVQWVWDFDDGSTIGSGPNPTHTYDLGATYDVELITESNYGCLDSVTVPVVVNPLPDADFSAPDVCLDQTTDFTDLSTVATGNITAWDWELQDGMTAISQDTSVVYSGAGVYNVELTVTTDSGCTDMITQPVEVFDLPVADFNYNDICHADEAVFTDASNIPSGSVNAWDWDFGDQTSSTDQNPSPHSYPSPDDYDVTLIAYSGNDCSDTITQTISVHPMPVADYTNNTVCFGTETEFTDLSTISSGSIDEHAWDFDDPPASSTTENPNHTFSTHGTYDVELITTSDFGCDDTIVQTVEVYAMPTADFNNTEVCLGEQTAFTDQSTIPAGNIQFWNWDFGDSGTSTLTNAFHTFDTAMFHDVTLVVTSDNGCSDTVTQAVEVFPLPQVDFTSDVIEGCQPLRVQFSDLSDIATGYNVDWWLWEFGDSNFSSEQDPVHVYGAPGVYTVTLTAKSSEGCTVVYTIDDMITVWPKPNAEFTASPQPTSILYPEIDFDDASSGANDWFYDFGDNTTDTLRNTQHIYEDVGSYPVTQIVENEYGCMDTVMHIITIDPDFTFYIPNTFTPNGDGHNETFFGTGIGVKQYEMRIFNRWGELLYTSFDEDDHWDGTKRGSTELVKQDVYVYVFKILDVFDETHTFRGHVTMLKAAHKN